MSLVRISQPQIGVEERLAVNRVLNSGHLTQGPEVAAFERDFSMVVENRACVAVSSGTAALHLGLLAAGVGPGDEVVVPAFSFAATANAVSLTGATPVFADIDASTYCLNAAAVEAVLSPRTAGVMPVHLFGRPTDMDAIADLAARKQLAVYEDAAQAHGARWRGRAAGSFGCFAAFSLYATKNITSGEGGMVAVADESLRRRLRLLRNQGMEVRYEYEIVGFNARMTDLHAAIGRAQLKKLHAMNAARRSNASFLLDRLSGVEPVILPTLRPEEESSWHQFTVLVPDRDRMARVLLEKFGIETGIYYPAPLHKTAAHNSHTELPVTERVARECLSLPVHPSLTEADLERVASAVRAYFEG